jgi:hypothetical protein
MEYSTTNQLIDFNGIGVTLREFPFHSCTQHWQGGLCVSRILLYTRAEKYTNTLAAEYTVNLTRVYITLLRCLIHMLLVPSTEYLETSPVARQSIVLHPPPSHNIKYSGIISAGQIHSHQGSLSHSEIMTWQQRVHIRQGQVQESFETLTNDKHACTEQFLS